MRIKKTDKVDQIRELHARIFPQDDKDILDTDELWQIADDNNELVGFCSARVLDKEIIYFNWAGLLEKAWGQGLHKRMIKARVRWAKKNGFKYAITYTIIENIQSSKNLLKTGFELYIPDFEWGNEKCLYFRRKF